MTTGETNDNDLPRAADVLREAYALARSFAAAPVVLDRAALLLGIARELREGTTGDVAELRAEVRKLRGAFEVVATSRDRWKQRAVEFGWREGLPPPFPADAPVSAPVYDTVAQGRLDHGQTYETLDEQFVGRDLRHDAPESPSVQRLDLFAYGPVVTRDGAQYTEQIAAIVDEATRAVPVVKPQQGGGSGPVVDWPLVEGTCPSCGGETYRAMTATGDEMRHRSTGTPACPSHE